MSGELQKVEGLLKQLNLLGNTEERLTNWKNQPSLVDLKRDFEDAKHHHNIHMEKVRRWLDNLNVEGTAKIQSKKGTSSVQPKLIRKQAEWRYSSLSEPFLSTSELFEVSPVSWEDRKSAVQNALVLNNQFQTKINKTAFIDELVRAVVDEGTAVIRVGWKYEKGMVNQSENQYQYIPAPELMEQYQQMLPQLQANPKLFKAQTPEPVFMGLVMSLQLGQGVRAILVGKQTKQVEKVIHNHPTLEVCDIRNVYIDPTCNGDIDKAQFVVHSYETTLSDLKRSGRYKNLDKVVLEGMTNSDMSHTYADGSETMSFQQDERKRLTVYEYWGYWDIDGKGITKPIVASWVGNTLIRLEENPFPDGKIPFIAISYLPKRKSIYGEPDGELLEDNQRILGAVTRGMIDLLGRSANGQTGRSKQFLDATNKKRFENGEDYEYNPQSDPRRDVFMHTYPEIPNSAVYMVQSMNMEAESLTGVKAFSNGGITGEGLGETAAGVRGALDASSKRELGILRRLGNGITQAGRKIIAMNGEFLSEEEVIRITNDEFVTIRRDDLAGNFDLKLTISTAEADNAKAQELAFMLQTMGNNLDPSMSNMLLAEIARLRNMPDLAHAIMNFKPEPDPIAEQMKQLQVQLLQAQVALAQAQAQEAGAKSEVHLAKVGVEHARAESLQSDADNKSLDFLQERTGEKHQRELEKERIKYDADLARQLLQQYADREKAKTQLHSDILRQRANTGLDVENHLAKSFIDSKLNPKPTLKG